MVDAFGQILDQPRHTFRNQVLLQRLLDAGVVVDIFRPNGERLSHLNRLHCKICAIDNRTVFVGGSNIGDHYLDWDDSNLRMDGCLGPVFHRIYDFVQQFSEGQAPLQNQEMNLSAKRRAEISAGLCWI